MGAYLDDNPPVRSQFRRPRREAWCGVIPVHTSEGVKDDVGPDTGTDVLGRFIRGRTDGPGSYHCPVDSDSWLELVADDAEAFSVEADTWNRASWNLSYVCRTVDLHPADGWTVAAMLVGGGRMVAKWREHGFCPSCSARWLSRDEALQVRATRPTCPHGLGWGGLVCHGTLQPYDRSDAWSRHPFRAELEQLQLDAIRFHLGELPTSPAPQEDELMHVHQIAYDETTGQLWDLWGYPNQFPYNGCYIQDDKQLAETLTLWGATPIPGNQGALVEHVLRMSGKTRPGQGQGLTLADLNRVRDQVVAGVQHLLEADGRDVGDASAFAAEVVDQLGARLTGSQS